MEEFIKELQTLKAKISKSNDLSKPMAQIHEGRLNEIKHRILSSLESREDLVDYQEKFVQNSVIENNVLPGMPEVSKLYKRNLINEIDEKIDDLEDMKEENDT